MPVLSDNEQLLFEWTQFFDMPELGQRTLDAMGDLSIARALDIGCGAGQELIPLVTTKGAKGFGVDVRAESLGVASELLASIDPKEPVRFANARAEALPFDAKTFDAVIFRLVIGYTDVRLALTELVRVLRPGGIAIVQMHNARHDVRTVWRALKSRELRATRYPLRELAAGTIFHFSGHQPHNSWTGRYVFFSRRIFERELPRAGLRIVGEIPHGNPYTCAMVATRPAG